MSARMKPSAGQPLRYASFGFAIGVLVSTACVSLPEQAYRESSGQTASLLITDYVGEAAMPLDAPRMPRLRVVGLDRGLQHADDEIAWLFASSADDTLLADLERAPLVAAQRDRIVPCTSAWIASDDGALATLELLPMQPLAPGAEYVLALAAWALEDADNPAPVVLDLLTSREPTQGAEVSSAWPAAGSVGVGTDLPSAMVVFDGAIDGAEDGVWLEGPDGLAIAADVRVDACSAFDAALGSDPQGVSCVQLMPTAWLAPLSPYRIVVGTSTRDRRGAPVGPFVAPFRTGPGPDAAPPQPIARACAIDEQSFALGCALVSDHAIALRLRVNEPFAATVRANAQTLSALAPSGETRLEIANLEPGMDVQIDLELRDSTGNTLAHSETLRTYDDLAALSITEVRADPLGPEPNQELVELWNFGDVPIALGGMQLSDQEAELGVPFATDAHVDPGARVLLVADGFDETDPNDVPVPPGTPLVRVGKSLASAGLANRGEALFLRDAQGRRVSAAPSTPAPLAGVCAVRVSSDPRDGASGSFALDADQACTPGW